MKLRSGLTLGMNSDTKAIVETVASLGELYKRGEILLASDNSDSVSNLMHQVNSVYDNFVTLCSNLSVSDMIPGTSITKLDVDEGYWDFKLKVKNWFESFNASSQNPGAAHGDSLPQVTSEFPESSKMPSVSEPTCPNAPTGQNFTTSELSKMPSASEPRSNGQPNTSVRSDGLGDRHTSQPSDPPKFSKSSSKKSQRSRSSKSSASSAKREAARIKLELARLKKL